MLTLMKAQLETGNSFNEELVIVMMFLVVQVLGLIFFVVKSRVSLYADIFFHFSFCF